MSLKKKNYDMEMQTLQTLSQKLAGKTPTLQDYACNLNADKIAILDLYIKQLKGLNENELLAELITIREELKVQGEALWIMHADVLTNLGLKVGRTGAKPPIDGTTDDTES